jgi:hemoglobin
MYLVGAAVAFVPMQATGQHPAASAKVDTDAVLNGQLRLVLEVGVKIFNEGNAEGCFRLYEGAIIVALPQLDSRPDLKSSVETKLAKARTLRPAEGAFELREAIDMIRDRLRGGSTLWARLGGDKAVRAVVHEFVSVAAPDPKVNFLRNGAFKLDAKGVVNLENLLVELISSVTGGPIKYTGRDMKTAHAGMKITEDEFNALAGHLVATLQKIKVPQKEADELVAIVASTKKDIVEVPKKPLWDRLGGEKAVRAVVVEFLTTAAKDPKANIDRKGEYPLTKDRAARVEQQLVELVSMVTGGPLKYTGRDMKNAHQGMGITAAEFDAAAVHLIAALKKFNVPQPLIDEFVGIVATTKKDIVEKP